MGRRVTGFFLSAWLALIFPSHIGLISAQRLDPEGVVVEDVREGSAAKAGIQSGDVLLNWSRAAASPANPDAANGEISSPFEMTQLEIEQALRGDVTLNGSRNGKSFSVKLPPGDWNLRTRPTMPMEFQGAYDQGSQLIQKKETDDGLNLWRDVAARASRDKRFALACWFFVRIGDVLADSRNWPAAREAYERAAQDARAAGDPIALAGIWDATARSFQRENEFAKAEEAFGQALRIREQNVPQSLTVAATLHNIGNMALIRGDLNAAEGPYTKALAIRERFAAVTLVTAATLNNLGIVSDSRGELAAASQFHRRALRIKEEIAPDSLSLTLTLNNLAILEHLSGDLAAAEDLHRRALAIREKLAPGSMDLAITLNNLGLVSSARGNLTDAEDHYRRSLRIKETLAPGSIDVATTLANLGVIAYKRGDLASAEDSLKRALTIFDKQAPDSLFVSDAFVDLGLVARLRGKLKVAEDLHQRALRIQETLAPGSFTVANTLHEMGTTSLQAGNSGSATDYFRRAVESLESQRAKLARADDRRSGFAAQHIDYYRDYTTQLLATDQPELAFHTVERSRARGLLEMLAERDLFFSNDLSADLERERRQVDAEYDQIQAGIGRLNPGKDAEQIQRLVAQMRELRDKQQEIRERIRNASPRLAALQYPEPLDLQRVQQMLDPGTVLLSYMVTSQKTFLFAIAGGPPKGRSAFAVFPLPISQDALRAKIESFRSEIQRPHERGQQWLQQGQDLYTVLVKPAGDFIAASSRVLISPDGPLHALPFGALVMEQTSARSGVSVPRYWIEAKPLHVVTSATLYAELRKGRRQAPVSVIAFGDPNYSAVSRDQIEALVDPEVGSILRSGNSLEPLPSTRAEVAALAGLYGKQATIYLGRQATEERAKSISKDARYLHFAVHGILNERFPLNSALALSVPDKPGEGQDNGLLQAWEIFEHVRVNAELVVLSACETALGREMGGEGLVGLTRAFQYAGARSIVASLWSVGDESTAELMKRFYRYLKANKTKDEALRSAQLDLIRQRGNVSHPFHWAAFELIGDWK